MRKSGGNDYRYGKIVRVVREMKGELAARVSRGGKAGEGKSEK